MFCLFDKFKYEYCSVLRFAFILSIEITKSLLWLQNKKFAQTIQQWNIRCFDDPIKFSFYTESKVDLNVKYIAYKYVWVRERQLEKKIFRGEVELCLVGYRLKIFNMQCSCYTFLLTLNALRMIEEARFLFYRITFACII